MNVLIIDDEPMPAKRLALMCQQYCSEIKNTTVCLSTANAISILETQEFDLIFLDIEMPEMSGFDLLEQALLPKETQVIITTAHEQYAVKAFKVEVTHYLLKPIAKEELILAVHRASQKIRGMNESKTANGSTFSVYDGEKYIILQKDNIVRMQADGSYTNFILEEGANILASRRLGYYEEQLNDHNFFRCHNSHLINIKKIYSIDRGKASCITLKNKEKLPTSKAKMEKLKMLLGL